MGQARGSLLVRHGLTERDRLRDMTIAQVLGIAGWAARPVADHRGDRGVSTPTDSVDRRGLTRLLAVGQQRHALERKGMKLNVLKLHPGTFAAVQRAVSIVYRRHTGDGLIEGAPAKTVAEVLGISVVDDTLLARDAMPFAHAAPAAPALVAA